MVDEYIRRSDALNGAELFQCGWAEIEAVQTDYIERLPAADVAPVVHGEWYLLDDCANAGLYCSVCSRRVHREEFAYKKLRSKYCPHCGAKMDGGEDRAVS